MADGSPQPRIFLSYARADGADVAAKLRAAVENPALTADRSLAIWQDLSDMRSGDWREQIRAAIEPGGHLLAVVTQRSLTESEVCAWEWSTARIKGTEISPILVGLAVKDLPKWMRAKHVYQLDLDAPDLAGNGEWQRLVASLRAAPTSRRMPIVTREPTARPEQFVPRPAEMDALRDMLLDANGDAVGVTTAFAGSGGMGKTTLALALARDPQIQSAFHGGQLLIELGQSPNLPLALTTAVRELTGETTATTSVNEAASALAKALAERSVLLVIDDVWDKAHLAPFLHDASTPQQRGCARLVTTRNVETLPAPKAGEQRRQVDVDEMRPEQALALLLHGLPPDQVPRLQPRLVALAKRLGHCAQVIDLARGRLESRIFDGWSLDGALDEAEISYAHHGVDAFDNSSSSARTDSYRRCITASLDILTDAQRARLLELAIFPEDTDLPYGTIALLWADTAAMAEPDAVALLDRLRRMSLVKGSGTFSRERDTRAIRFHDVVRDYLRHRDQQPPERLVDLNRRLWSAHVAAGAAAFDAKTTRGKYAYARGPWHLDAAGERQKLDALLTDVAWMQEKLAALASPLPLIEDYRAYAPYLPERKTAAALVGRALAQSAGALGRDERQLVPHLLGRLRADMAPGVGDLLARARRSVRPPALVPRRPTLSQADSPLLWTFEGHSSTVYAVAFSPDGKRLVSGSQDLTLRLWDVKSGTAFGTPLVGHEGHVMAVAFSPDGRRIVSGSSDGSLRLWDAVNGEAIGAPLTGHRGGITTVAFSPDGRRVVSGSSDKTLRLWDVMIGAAVGAPLVGHEDPVTGVAFSPDGQRIVSSSGTITFPDMLTPMYPDNSLRLWEAASGSAVGKPIVGHDNMVTAVAFSPDGGIFVSGSNDHTLRRWDAISGAAIGEPMTGHEEHVTSVAFSPDGRHIVSSSYDNSLRLWDATSGAAIGSVTGHLSHVNSVIFSPDGRHIVSGASDNTLRLWDATSGWAHDAPRKSVNAVAISPDGTRIVSGASDVYGNFTLRMWDAVSGAVRGELEVRNADSVYAVQFSPDGRRIVLGHFGSLELLDAASIERYGSNIESLRSFGWAHRYMAFSPDGLRIVSLNGDKSLQQWNAENGREIGEPVKGHDDKISAVAFSPDGKRIVSGSKDKKLRLWDAASGATIGAPLAGHDEGVNAVAFSSDSTRIISGSSDNTLRLWDAATGAAIGPQLAGHRSGISAVTFSAANRCIISGSYDKSVRLWETVSGAEISRFEADAKIEAIAVVQNTLVAGDSLEGVHIFDVIHDETAKAGWLACLNASPAGSTGTIVPTPPLSDIEGVAPGLQVTTAALAGARWLETYRSRHLFALADGRFYLDGLIAVSSLDHARATLDEMARRAGAHED